MIEIKHVETFGFKAAIRGMRNPYMSHDRSDSEKCKNMACVECFLEGKSCVYSLGVTEDTFVLGKADMELAKKLIKAGPEHRKFLRMIHIQCDVLASRYWWAEMDKYKFVEANSSSTMHLITKRELTLDDFSYIPLSCDTVKYAMDEINCKIQLYNQVSDRESRDKVLIAIKQMLPESFNQLRTIDTNYEALLSIHHQRKNHRLSEWKEFSRWIESLPYMKEFLEVKDAD